MTSQSSRRWVRPVVGLVLTLAWIAVAGLGGPYFGRIGEVSTNDQASYLPSSAESTQVQKRLTDFFGDDTIPAVVVAERVGGLTVEDRTWLEAQSGQLPEQVPAISGGVSPAILSTDGEAAQIFVPLSIMVGGQTATALDSNLTSARDRNLIIPVVLVVITLILMVLLRSIVAPLLLMLTTVLSFGAALGVSSVFFNNVLGFPGSDPSVPLYGFVFLVALGIDYNIFLMTRVREESLAHGTKEGVLRGLVATGGVITSAGVVLAATFAALAVIPILFLAQLAIIVAFGVLLDALVVRALFVPALVYDVGDKVWWPSKLAGRGRGTVATCREEAAQSDRDS